MRIFMLIIFGIPLLSLAWWVWADRRLRGLGAGRGWRVTLGLALLVILIGFIWVVLGRRNLLAVPLPAEWYALVLLWGLIFLPLLAVPLMVVWSLGSIVRRVFRRKPESIPRNPELQNWTRREWSARSSEDQGAVTAFHCSCAFPQKCSARHDGCAKY